MADSWIVKAIFWYVWFREGHRIWWFTFRAHWWRTFSISYSRRRICWWITNLMHFNALLFKYIIWYVWLTPNCRNCCRFVLWWKGHTSAARSKYCFPSLWLKFCFCPVSRDDSHIEILALRITFNPMYGFMNHVLRMCSSVLNYQWTTIIFTMWWIYLNLDTGWNLVANCKKANARWSYYG